MDSNNIPIKKRKPQKSHRYINDGKLTDEGKEFLGETFREAMEIMCDHQDQYDLIDETDEDVTNRIELFVWFLDNCFDDCENLISNNMEVTS